jgi:NAD(P)-dependent dehydrogenase (short-subunit alcohol dehydrogenase family)
MKQYVVFGATGGIGLALCAQILKENNAVIAVSRQSNVALQVLVSQYPEQCQFRQLALCDQNETQNMTAILPNAPHVVINALGLLHQAQMDMKPEKNIIQMSLVNFEASLRVNTFSSVAIAQWLTEVMKRESHTTFVALSAKLASIQDNQLGGWYSYRMSKAALNMLIKTLSIEWQRSYPNSRVISMHPGTTETTLSAPYIGAFRRPVFPQALTAQRILRVIDQSPPIASGAFVNWDGNVLPY